ncbi:MAG: ATP-binding protein [Chloroflexi bacterium]|nr:ATP-binding protein [Chloroflexota bacterium]
MGRGDSPQRRREHRDRRPFTGFKSEQMSSTMAWLLVIAYSAEREVRRMAEIWDEARVQRYIDDGIEESLNLDYKAAGALAKTDRKRREITKDVSAMANSDGGFIIYGVSEDENYKHLPGQIDPVNRKDLSKEWLEQVISNIRPKVDGLLIYPVPIGNSNTDVVYVVEIPKSHTAHQAMDKRYYRRFNFESVMMDDYEIRDVMNREQHPQIELDFKIIRSRFISSDLSGEHETEPQFRLEIHATNSGRVYAQHTDIHIEIPPKLQHSNSYSLWDEPETDAKPMHPGRRYQVRVVALSNDFDCILLDDLYLKWIVSADNAPKSEGNVAFSAIKVSDSTVRILHEPMNID